MRYLIVSFIFPGQWGSGGGAGCENPKANRECLRIVKRLRKVLNDLNTRSAYVWPDGSFYYYLKTQRYDDSIRSLLSPRLAKLGGWIANIKDIGPNYKPYGSEKTIKEIFKASEKLVKEIPSEKRIQSRGHL